MTFDEAWDKVANIIQMTREEAMKLYEFANSLPEGAVIVEL